MIELPENHNNDHLFISLIHLISERFKNHAILKGGMVFKLLGSERQTMDLDYTFVPYKSKKDVISDLQDVCSSIKGSKMHVSINSKAIRIIIKTQTAQAQIEVSIDSSCKSIPISTGNYSRKLGMAPRIIRIMSFDVSLANKLAAWFERRLIRDLYDIYFLSTIAKPIVDMDILKKRLSKIESKIPKLKKIKKVSFQDFLAELKDAITKLDQITIKKELTPIISQTEIAGLDIRIKKTILELIHLISSHKQ